MTKTFSNSSIQYLVRLGVYDYQWELLGTVGKARSWFGRALFITSALVMVHLSLAGVLFGSIGEGSLAYWSEQYIGVILSTAFAAFLAAIQVVQAYDYRTRETTRF